MKKFDILTPIGIVLGFALIVLAVVLASGFAGLPIFISLSSIVTVVGGLIASILVHYGIDELKELPTAFKKAFYKDEEDIRDLVELFIDLSTVARREGLLALDNKVDELEDEFIKKGILLTVDGLEAEQIKEILSAEIVAVEERQKVGIGITEKAGELAPSWGMIGTLIGLVLMLKSLDDVSTLGPTMALALITTFYGSVLANLLFIPLSGKMQGRLDNEIYIRQIKIEGILGVQSGQNPKLLREKLEVFVDKKKEEVKSEESTSDNEEVTV